MSRVSGNESQEPGMFLQHSAMNNESIPRKFERMHKQSQMEKQCDVESNHCRSGGRKETERSSEGLPSAPNTFQARRMAQKGSLVHQTALQTLFSPCYGVCCLGLSPDTAFMTSKVGCLAHAC